MLYRNSLIILSIIVIFFCIKQSHVSKTYLTENKVNSEKKSHTQLVTNIPNNEVKQKELSNKTKNHLISPTTNNTKLLEKNFIKAPKDIVKNLIKHAKTNEITWDQNIYGTTEDYLNSKRAKAIRQEDIQKSQLIVNSSNYKLYERRFNVDGKKIRRLTESMLWQGQELGRRVEFMEGEILIKLNQPLEKIQETLMKLNYKIRPQANNSSTWFKLVLPEGTSVERALSNLSDANISKHSEPNYIFTSTSIPNDPQFDQQWSLNNVGQTNGTIDADIDAPEAWDIRKNSLSTLVAIIDSGIDYTHPDLVNNIWKNTDEIPGDEIDNDGNGRVDDVLGYDIINDDADPLDDNFHGTHVAGIVAAEGNNSEGVSGVCQRARIMIVKVLGAGGFGPSEAVADGIDYAVENGAKVINMSLGSYGFSQMVADAVDRAEEAGVLIVAAAGNDGLDIDIFPSYPSALGNTNIISVMATDHDDTPAHTDFNTNFGLENVDISAPGEFIYNTFPSYSTFSMSFFNYDTHYETISGTSMAAPHVTAICALTWSHHPHLDFLKLRTQVVYSTDIKESLQSLSVVPGRVNLDKALREDVSNVVQANAGDDLFVTVQALGASEEILLDASETFIAPGLTDVSYSWYLNDSQIASGLTATLSLPLGVYNITLVVTDNFYGDQSSDELIVNVVHNQAPVANPGQALFIADEDQDGSHLVPLDASASYDPDGNITRYQWFENDVLLAEGLQANVSLPVGAHAITLKVEDDGRPFDDLFILQSETTFLVVVVAPVFVPSDYATIQLAIDSLSNGAFILVEPGSYSGEGFRDIQFRGKNIVLKSVAGPEQTILDINHEEFHRHFYFLQGETRKARVEGFTLKGGHHHAFASSIYIENASPTFINNIISDNKSHPFIDPELPFEQWFRRSPIIIFGNSFPKFENNIIENNTGLQAASFYCDNTEEIYLENIDSGKFIEINNNFIRNNTNDNNAVFISDFSIVSIKNNRVTNNIGRGIFLNRFSNTRLENNVISQNSSTLRAPLDFKEGIFNYFYNNTVANNSVQPLSFQSLEASLDNANQIFIENNIFYNEDIVAGEIPDFLTVNYNNIRGGYLGDGVGNISANPLFINPAALNYKLHIGSPCVDSANATAAPLLDIEGNARYDVTVKTNTGVGTPNYVDMGAHEVQEEDDLSIQFPTENE